MVERLVAELHAAHVDGQRIRDWSLCVHESRSLTLGVKDREVGNPHAPLTLGESCDVSFRLIWDDARVSRGSLERSQLRGDLAQAVRFARGASSPDPDATIVSGPAPLPDVRMHDPAVAAIAAGDTGIVARRLADIRKAAAGSRTWSGSFTAAESRSRVLTSAGLDAHSAGTTFGWHVVLDGEAADGFGARRVDTDEEFAARLERLVATAARLAEPAAALAGGTRRVLLAPPVVESFVLSTLLDNLSGATVAHGEGHFGREQFGAERAVLREDLTLRIDPLLPLRRGTYRCTSEGVPADRCTFIERGRLLQPICDLKYAQRLGRRPTPLPAAADTTHIEGPPLLGLDEALAALDDAVLVLSVLGVHTQDRASGDFSLSAPQALAIARGGLAGRLRGTIAGNLFALLSSADLQRVAFPGDLTPGLALTCRFEP